MTKSERVTKIKHARLILAARLYVIQARKDAKLADAIGVWHIK